MNTQKLRELAEYIINSRLDNTASPQQRWKKEDEYIAAACPANILALIDSHAALLDIANECHKIIKELCACYSHHEPLATLERIEAITKAEAL